MGPGRAGRHALEAENNLRRGSKRRTARVSGSEVLFHPGLHNLQIRSRSSTIHMRFRVSGGGEGSLVSGRNTVAAVKTLSGPSSIMLLGIDSFDNTQLALRSFHTLVSK